MCQPEGSCNTSIRSFHPHSYPEYPSFVCCGAVRCLPIWPLSDQPAHSRGGYQSIPLVVRRIHWRILQVGSEVGTKCVEVPSRWLNVIIFGLTQKESWIYLDHCRTVGRPVHVKWPDAHIGQPADPVKQSHSCNRARSYLVGSYAVEDRGGVQSLLLLGSVFGKTMAIFKTAAFVTGVAMVSFER